MMRVMDALGDCEEALVAHWSQLGRLPGSTLHEEDGLVWFETPVRHLPYNGVVRIRVDGDAAADRAISRVIDRCAARGADCWWAVHPSATPSDIGDRLAAAGLDPVERMNFMALHLGSWRPRRAPGEAVFQVAEDAAALRAYTDLTLRYWEIPSEEQDAVADLHRAIVPGRFPGMRWLALVDGQPVGKAYLSLAGPPGVASIYGMSIRPEARGRRVASGLAAAMMSRAQALGCHRAVLHATDMAVGLYARVGFSACGSATVFATAPVWSDEH